MPATPGYFAWGCFRHFWLGAGSGIAEPVTAVRSFSRSDGCGVRHWRSECSAIEPKTFRFD